MLHRNDQFVNAFGLRTCHQYLQPHGERKLDERLRRLVDSDDNCSGRYAAGDHHHGRLIGDTVGNLHRAYSQCDDVQRHGAVWRGLHSHHDERLHRAAGVYGLPDGGLREHYIFEKNLSNVERSKFDIDL